MSGIFFATRWCLACSHVGFISPISMVNFWWNFWVPKDIVRAPGVQKILPFLVNCSRVDVHFREGDVLNQSFLQEVGAEDGPFPPHDLLFIDTSHTREQLAQELEAFSRYTKRYIILHDTETFGKRDELVHDEGTSISYQRKRKLLEEQLVAELQNAMCWWFWWNSPIYPLVI